MTITTSGGSTFHTLITCCWTWHGVVSSPAVQVYYVFEKYKLSPQKPMHSAGPASKASAVTLESTLRVCTAVADRSSTTAASFGQHGKQSVGLLILPQYCLTWNGPPWSSWHYCVTTKCINKWLYAAPEMYGLPWLQLHGEWGAPPTRAPIPMLRLALHFSSQ